MRFSDTRLGSNAEAFESGWTSRLQKVTVRKTCRAQTGHGEVGAVQKKGAEQGASEEAKKTNEETDRFTRLPMFYVWCFPSAVLEDESTHPSVSQLCQKEQEVVLGVPPTKTRD